MQVINYDSVFEVIENKEAVIFDLFHTLISINTVQSKNIPYTYEILEIERSEWQSYLKKNEFERLTKSDFNFFNFIEKIFEDKKEYISNQKIELAINSRLEKFKMALTEIPQEVILVLNLLKEKGKKLGLITNADLIEISYLNKSPLMRIFDSTVASCCVGSAKPESAIYNICLLDLGITAENAVFIGDGANNELHGAKCLGMTTILTLGLIKHFSKEEIEKRKKYADFVMHSLSEIIN